MQAPKFVQNAVLCAVLGSLSGVLALPGLGHWAAEARAAANPFRVEVEAPAGLVAGASGVLRVVVLVPEGFHVYRDMMHVEVVDPAGLSWGAPSFPVGLQTPDPANPSAMREVYDTNVVVEIPVKAGAAVGPMNARVEVKYQGCKKALCYMPATELVDVVVPVGAAGGAGRPKGARGAAVEPAGAPAVEAVDSGPPSWRAGALVSGGHGGAPAAAPSWAGLPASATVEKTDAEGKKHPVVARLVADAAPAAPGQPVRLGVHLTMDPGWHTYWKTPGDIGLPTEVTWKLPEGWSASPFGFPLPHRYDVSGIISYGYEDQVMFFSEVMVPPGTPAGELRIGAEVRWLVCEAMCIPGEATLELPVQIGAAAAPSPWAPLFERSAATLPAVGTATGAATEGPVEGLRLESGLSVSAVSPNSPFQLVLHLLLESGALEAAVEAGSWPAFTPILPRSVFLTSVKLERSEQGGLLVRMEGEGLEADPLPVGERIGGLFQVRVNGAPKQVEMTVPMPFAATGAPAESPLLALRGTPLVAPAAAAPDAAGAPAVAAAAPAPAPLPPAEDAGFLSMLLLAFLGGGILNIMPCVLPVLTLKMFSLVEQRDMDARRRAQAGLVYGAGVVASFLALAGVVIGAKAIFGESLGWGSQFQYPEYVLALTVIVFVFGLSLFGVFEVPAFGANEAAQASEKGGMVGYFLTGVFTTLLATPCSAPLLGSAMGFAFTLPPVGVLLFFGVAGLGLALPFVIVALVPAVMRFLPRPGAWMETFKHLMGFSLMATTVWLLDVLGGLLGRDGLTGVTTFLLALGVAAWAVGRFGGPIESTGRQLGVLLGAVAVSAAVGFKVLDLAPPPEPAALAAAPAAGALDYTHEVPWVAFNEANVEKYAGEVVFIDFTADWCLTCKVNEKTVIEQPGTRAGMSALGVVPLKADWTRRDPTISAWLQRYGRAGVPFYLILPKDRSKAAIPLGEVLTQQGLLDALKAAGT